MNAEQPQLPCAKWTKWRFLPFCTKEGPKLMANKPIVYGKVTLWHMTYSLIMGPHHPMNHVNYRVYAKPSDVIEDTIPSTYHHWYGSQLSIAALP